jgi:LysM domain
VPTGLLPTVSRHPVYVARRRRVLIAVVGALCAVVALFAVALGRVPASASGSHPGSSAQATHLVEPGETLWSIAESVHPGGNLAAYVDKLVHANGSSTIRVGQQIVLP